MTGAEMDALIQRVEQASGPDTALDWDIAVAITPPSLRGWIVHPYTGSLDAARRLTTAQIAVGHESKPGGRWYARHGDGPTVWAATPALALCAAALRARRGMEDNRDE